MKVWDLPKLETHLCPTQRKNSIFSLQLNGEAAATLLQAKNYSNCFWLASRCFGTLRTAAKAVTKKGYKMEITRKRVRTGNKRHQSKAKQSKVLEAPHEQPGCRMDTRAAQASKRSNQTVEAVEQSTGPKSPEGKAAVSGNAWRGGEWLKLRQAIKALNQALRQQKDLLG